jgi:hypothetical protein
VVSAAERLEWEWQVVSFHEAGHAVAIWVLDCDLHDIEIGAVNSFWSGPNSHGSTLGGSPDTGDTDEVDDYLVTCLAGPAAELMFGSPPRDVDAHAHGDMDNVAELLPYASLSLEEAQDAADELVEEFWEAIVLVAKALRDNNGYLTGADVDDLLG